MKRCIRNTLLLALLFLTPFAAKLSASDEKSCCEKNSIRLVGEFRIIGRGQWKSFLVSNNKVYHPTKHKYKHISKNWMVGDRLRIYAIRSSCKTFYILNHRTGKTIKAKILTIKS